jgi:hypothetical protein
MGFPPGNFIMELQFKSNLEKEKSCFLNCMCNFLDSLEFEKEQVNGRPRANEREIIKNLLVMSYNSMSYRRAISDIKILYNEGLISEKISRTTLNDYSNNEKSIEVLERLIQLSATYFKETEDTLIVDSSWFSEKMYLGGYKKVHSDKMGLTYTRKIHIGILKNSRVICYAKATAGIRHDCPVFKDILSNSVKLFDLKYCLGDAGYLSKDNYILCEDHGIKAFLNFKKNNTSSKGRSALWKQQIDIWRNKPKIWHESYRFRVLVESTFSTIKRKFGNYLRSKNQSSRDVEMLLKCLCYNLCVISNRFGQFTD